MIPKNKRRHHIGFGYIGFGNNHEVFNQRSKQAFSVVKEKLNEEKHLHHQINLSHKKPSKTEKGAINNGIRQREKNSNDDLFTNHFNLFLISVVSYMYLLSPLFNVFKH